MTQFNLLSRQQNAWMRHLTIPRNLFKRLKYLIQQHHPDFHFNLSLECKGRIITLETIINLKQPSGGHFFSLQFLLELISTF